MSTERRNITQPADWWAAFEQAAKHEQMTLSEWVGDCCAHFVRYAKLSERPAVGRPKLDKVAANPSK